MDKFWKWMEENNYVSSQTWLQKECADEKMLIGYMYEYIRYLICIINIKDDLSINAKLKNKIYFSCVENNHYQELVEIIKELEKIR